MERRMQSILRIIAPIGFLGACAAYMVAVAISGNSLPGLFLFAGVAVVLLLLPGLLVCELCLPTLRGLARLPVAVVSGAVCLVAGYVLFGSLHLVWLSALPSAVMAGYWLWRKWKKRRANRNLPHIKDISASLWGLLLLFAACLFIYSLYGILLNGSMPSHAGNRTYNQDMLWFIGNAAGVRYGFPLHDLRMAGGIVHYQYFSEAVAGLLAMYSGQSAWSTLVAFIWPMWMGSLLATLWCIARRMGAGPLLSLLAPVGLIFFQYKYELLTANLFINMNSVLQYCFYLMVSILLLQQAQAENFSNWKALLPAVACVGALLWSKTTIGILFLLAMAVSLPIYVFFQRKSPDSSALSQKQRRARWLWPVGMIALSGALLLLLYITLFSQVAVTLTFMPGNNLHGLQDALIRLYWPVTALYVLSLPVSIINFKKFSYADFTINAVIIGGILAVSLFWHFAASEWYFLYSACFLMWLAITRAAVALKKFKWPVAIVITLACAMAASGTFAFFANYMYEGTIVGMRTLDIREKPIPRTVEYSIVQDDEEVALWLKENMTLDETFVTNRNNKSREKSDGVFHYYTAVSERQAYVESAGYAFIYSVPHSDIMERVDAIYAADTYEEAAALARQYGIDYIVLFLPIAEGPFEGGVPVFASGDVLVYKVD